MIRRSAALFALYLVSLPACGQTDQRGTAGPQSRPSGHDGATVSVTQFGASPEKSAAANGAAIQAAIDALPTGGVVVIPPGLWKVDAVRVQIDGITLRGAGRAATILDFTSSTGGPAVAFAGTFDFGVADMTIRNAAGDGLEVNSGALRGPHPYAAYGRISQVAIQDGRGNGFVSGNLYQTSVDGLRAQGNKGAGIVLAGYSTSLTITASQALKNGGDGWRVANTTYSTLIGCGSDGNAGFGYSFAETSGVSLLSSGAEANTRSALGLAYISTAKAEVHGLGLSVRDFVTRSNAAGRVPAQGYLATFSTDAPASLNAGRVGITGWREVGSPAASRRAIGGAGAFRVIAPQGMNDSRLTWTAAPGFATMSDGATDLGFPLPVAIGSGPTRIATIGPKLANGLGSYSGLLVVDVAQNNRSSGSRQASYLLHVSRSADGTGAMNVVSGVGKTSGASAADPSFTFAFDPSSGALSAARVGSTAAGNWYFSIAILGGLSVTP